MEIIGIIICFLLVVIILLLYKIKPEPKETYVPAISQFNPKTEITTVCPVPLGALGCMHDFVVVTKDILEVSHEKKCIVILKCEKCGLIDKTIVVTSIPPKMDPTKNECRHKWNEKKAVVLGSAYEQMLKSKGINKGLKQPEVKIEEVDPWMFRKTYVSIRICTLCGEIDKCIVSNLNEDLSKEQIEDGVGGDSEVGKPDLAKLKSIAN